MKKFRVALVTALVLLVSLLCLVGCGVEGTYKFDSMEVTVLGKTTTLKAGDKFMEGTDYEMELSADYCTISLKSGGACTVNGSVWGLSTEETGTWEEKDGKINITIDGETVSFTKDGNKLVMDMDGAKVILKK